MNRKYFLRQTLAGLTLVAGTFLSAFSYANTTLTMSSWVPPTHFLPVDILQPWMAEVAKVTEGRVTIKMLPTAVGSPAQHWKLARKGVADVTWGNFTYEPERFEMMWFAEMPMMGSNAEATSVALWRTYQKYLANNDAMKGVVMLGVGMLGGGQINHGSKPVVTPEDLAGQKVRMGGPIQKNILEKMGAVPVAAPATKAYELIEGGVIDASLHGFESVVNFRLDGKLKYHTTIPEGLYDGTFFIVINEAKWKSISAADQKSIMRVSGENLSRHWGQEFNKQNKSAEAKMRVEGHIFIQPGPALLEKVKAIRATMLKEWYARSSSFGVSDGPAVVTFYEEQYKALAK
jgi:TRAP-type C4-dicarboxylate transport system substrate-binding protein